MTFVTLFVVQIVHYLRHNLEVNKSHITCIFNLYNRICCFYRGRIWLNSYLLTLLNRGLKLLFFMITSFIQIWLFITSPCIQTLCRQSLYTYNLKLYIDQGFLLQFVKWHIKQYTRKPQDFPFWISWEFVPIVSTLAQDAWEKPKYQLYLSTLHDFVGGGKRGESHGLWFCLRWEEEGIPIYLLYLWQFIILYQLGLYTYSIDTLAQDAWEKPKYQLYL